MLLVYCIPICQIILIVVSNIRQTEGASCQCTCSSSSDGNVNTQDNLMKTDWGGGTNSKNPESRSGSSRHLLPADTLPTDKMYCLTDKKCVCYDVWKDEMDRKMYKPCLDKCEFVQSCMDAVPGNSLQWYAYQCRKCNVEDPKPPHYKLNHCILDIAAIMLDTIEYAEGQGQVYKFCSRSR